MIIAIHPENYTNPSVGKCDASSPRWAELLHDAGHEVRWVDVYRADILEQLRGCHGFMWRWAHFGGMCHIARRLLPVVERELGLVTYPDQNTCWHYDDKIAQAYLLPAAGIPVPRTWVWHEQQPALDWARTAEYPVVLKLSNGAASSNVRLIRSFDEASGWIKRLFSDGVYALDDKAYTPWEHHRNYVLFQEFLPGNNFDTRVTIIGNRAFAYRRFNRPNDFRASGSGNFSIDPAQIDLETVRLAFAAAKRLRTQSMAIDGLRRGNERVIGEISYTYVSWMVHECSGHWELQGNDLKWCVGQMWPEEAQIQDFLKRLQAHKKIDPSFSSSVSVPVPMPSRSTSSSPVEIAEGYVQRGDFKSAIQSLEVAAKLYPDSSEILTALTQLREKPEQAQDLIDSHSKIISITNSIVYLTDCFAKCPSDRSLEPSQLTEFHRRVRSIPQESAFPANHLVSFALKDVVSLPLNEALAVGEYWIARNQLVKAKELLNQLFQMAEQDYRVQDAFFRAIWYETHGLPEQVGYELKGQYCMHPFERTEVYEGGSAHFCCTGWQSASIGNLFAVGKIDEIWNSETAKEIRRTIIDGSYRYCRKMHCNVINGVCNEFLIKRLPVEYAKSMEEQNGCLSTPPTRFNFAYDKSCNLTCPSCRSSKIVAGGVEADRILRITKDVVGPLLKTAKEVSLNGAGELFVSPAFRWLLSRLATVKNPTLFVGLQTNGLLFTPTEWARIEGLGNLYLNVTLSIDASDASTYARLRVGGDFNRLLQNMEFMKNLRDNGSIKEFHFRCVVQDENIDQLESIVLLGKQYHADRVQFMMFRDWGSCSPQELARKKIQDPNHPRHRDLLKNLAKALSHKLEIKIVHEFEYLQGTVDGASGGVDIFESKAAFPSTIKKNNDCIITPQSALEITTAPSSPVEIAEGYVQQGDFKSAIQSLEVAAKLYPNSTEIVAALAKLRDKNVISKNMPAKNGESTIMNPLPQPTAKVASRKLPRILLIADLPNWIFARHCQMLQRFLSDRFEFTTLIRYENGFNEKGPISDLFASNQPLRENDYDLIYPLEWNLVPNHLIRTPAKYVTGIRSHILWQSAEGVDFLRLAKQLAQNFQRVHVVSRRLLHAFQPFLPSVAYVTHGVDTEFFSPEMQADQSGKGKLRLGWAGSGWRKAKGVEQYIEPLKNLRGIELVVNKCQYGDSKLNMEQMRQFYNSIDAYVCASSVHYEGNNNSLMEAAAMKRAIVTTDNGTVPEYLRHGESAFVIEREVPNFIHAVIALRDNPELRVSMGEQARRNVQQRFEWEKMAEDYATFFNGALAGRHTWRPDDGKLRYLYGAVGDKEDACMDEKKRHRIEVDDPRSLEADADRAFTEGRYQEGQELYQRILQQTPNKVSAMLGQAKCGIRLGQYVLAKLLLEEILRLAPGNAEAEALYLCCDFQDVNRSQATLNPKEKPVTESLAFLTTSLANCPADRSVEPSKLTEFHRMVRSIPEENAFPSNHLVSSAVENVVKCSMNQALAVGEYWIARNQLVKAKQLLNQLFQRDERDSRVQDAFFRTIWYETHGLPEQVGCELKGRYCPHPFSSFEIDPKGEVNFCCQGWMPTTIGNLFKDKKVDEIWNSEISKEIRSTIIDGSYRYCHKIHCPLISGALKIQLKENLPFNPGEEQGGHLTVLPTQFALHYDRSCNLFCPSCRQEKYVAAGKEAKQLMQVTQGKVFPLLKTAKSVSLCGNGEAFVSPAFRWLLSELASMDNPALGVEVQTNGQLFTEREWSRISGLGRLNLVFSVSIDASDPATYARLRRGGDFKHLLQNLELMKRLRNEGAIKYLRFRCVVQEENVAQLESFVLMAKQYHADEVHLQMFHNIVGSHEELASKRVHDPSHPRHRELLENLTKALSHASEIQILHEFDYLLKEYPRNNQLSKTSQKSSKGVGPIQTAKISESLDFLIVCLESNPTNRSVEPSKLTAFHQMVRSIPHENAFPLNHIVSSSMEEVVALPLNQALAVSEYWIARNKLTKAKDLLTKLYQRDEYDHRIQDSLFRARWYDAHGLPEKVGNELTGRYCAYPFMRAEIFEGETFFCCPTWGLPSIGDLFAGGKIDEVWNSEKAKEIRKAIIDGSYRYCRKISCHVLNGTDRGALKANFPAGYVKLDGRLTVQPSQFALSYDRSCNLSCPSCRPKKIIEPNATAERYLQITKNTIFPMLQNAKYVQLNGKGDPFASPAHRWLLSQLSTSGKTDLSVDIQTNGLLFTEREWSRINGLGRRHLAVMLSIDASESPTYTQLRRGGDFNKLLKNLELIKALRDEKAIKLLTMRCVVQEENIEQLESFVLMAKRYHADKVILQMFHDFGSCTPEELARKMVQNPSHPRHRDFLNNLSKAVSHGSEIQILHEFEQLLKDYRKETQSNNVVANSDSLSTASRSLGLDSKQKESLQATADRAFAEGRYQEGQELYQRLAQESSGAVNALLGQAKCSIQLGQQILAKLLLEEILKLDPENTEAKACLQTVQKSDTPVMPVLQTNVLDLLGDQRHPVMRYDSQNKAETAFTSCQWLEYGLVLFDRSLACCCIGEHEGGGRPMLVKDYHGELINYDELFKAKWERRKLQRQGKTNKECVGCCYLTKQNWSEQNVIKSMTLAYWTHCNCRCTYCYTQEDIDKYSKHKPYNSLPVIKDMIAKGVLARDAYISFGGGECTILSEFEELVELLLNHGPFLEIFSNAIKFSPMIKRGVSENKMCVTVSLDAGTSETFKKIKQVDVFDKVWRNLRSYAETQPSGCALVKTKYILIPGVNDSLEELKLWMDMNKAHGIREVLLDIDHNFFKTHRDRLPEELLALEVFVGQRARELEINYHRTRNFLQMSGTKP